MSTSNLDSIQQDEYTDSQGNKHLALKYVNGDCSLKVGLICD